LYIYIFGLFAGLAYFYRPMSQVATKIKELLAAIPAATRRKAEKFPVREAEETDKGNWVAFVDDGAESYDVQLSLSKGNLLQHTCDCGKVDADGFCLHQLPDAQKWKNKVVRKLADNAGNNIEFAKIYFAICARDKKYNAMLNLIGRSGIGHLLPAYFDVLYQFDKSNFLLKLSTLRMQSSPDTEELGGYTLLAQKIFKHYHYMERSVFLKADRSYFGSNFIPFCERIWQEN